ncbi:hypothetical protein [Embleya sp. NBC_00896]|uniref:hypothetical protein n=1 Tax=Embleya sp. NBC_00896 TaxID=2975961 RepID=UPI00386766D2|nr:hypothetical protein OG928_21860 [Embleya sp. NBC_00896]
MTAKIRRTAAIAVTTGLLLAAGAAAPVLAAASAPPGVEQTRRVDVVQRVTAFYDQYKSAVEGTNPYMNPEEVRAEFLTPELDARLTEWANENQADPVFRAQNVPQDRSVRYEGSGASHATVIVTEYWGSGSPTEVWYQVPLDGGRISDLTDPPQ